ncbi:MAG: EAL domain-containing protein [Acidothermus cellulolyticus]|nr:EAL domain-containing protein [Acidothermus cellulolyticus]
MTDGPAPARRPTSPGRPDGWAAAAIAHFLAAVVDLPQPQKVLLTAVQQLAQTLAANRVAIVQAGHVLAGSDDAGDTDGPKRRRLTRYTVPVGGPLQGELLIERDRELDEAERTLVTGMARAVEMSYAMGRTLEAERRLRTRSERQANVNAKLLASLRERQRLLEALSGIQRMISRREPLVDILDAVVRTVHDVLGVDTVIIRRGPSATVAARCGGTERTARWLARLPLPDGTTGGVHDLETANPPAGIAVTRALAGVVHENGRIAGALIAATTDPARLWRDADRGALGVFADHVTLAITDATTVEAMNRAFHDSLTGLASRALFLDRLNLGLAQAARSGTNLCLLFIDLDRFKIVNDTLGHAAGDVLLVEIANRLRSCLRASDTAARYGGDEFVALLHDTDVRGAAIVAARIIDAVRQPLRVGEMDVTVDASIGIACSVAGGTAADDLLRSADVAMYRAKRAGRGRYAIYEPSMHAALLEQLHLETELRGALHRGEFVVHYQPIVELATGDILGAEALLRWNHPRRGLLTAAEFVPIAEDCGEMVEIGSWVLRTACAQARAWQRELGEAPFTISVNVSTAQLAGDTFAGYLKEVLENTGLAATSLVLDITEALVLREEPWLLARLEELKLLGVSLAVDDFGARYSSLAGLPRLPLDMVKIDQAFIDAVGTPEGSAFARKIVELAHTLDLQVIAEGVQTQQQFEELRRARCEFAQGYLFAEPVDTDRVPALRPTAQRLWRPTVRRSR